MQQIVNVVLGGFSLDSLGGASAGDPATIAASHAVLYFAGDRDSGRLTQRIVEGLGKRQQP